MLSGCGKKQDTASNDLQVIKERGKVIIGVRDDTKPFGYRDENGNLVGFEVDLAKMIAGYLLGDPSKVEFVVVKANDRIGKLNTKRVDFLIATMTVTQQRMKVVDFSNSYFVAGQAVMIPTHSQYTSFNELADKRLIVVYGTTGEKSLRNVYPAAKIFAYKSYSEAFEALQKDEADAIVADDTVLLGYVLDHRTVKLLNKRYSREPYAIAFRQGKASQSLRFEVNEYLNYLISTGKIRKLAERYKLL